MPTHNYHFLSFSKVRVFGLGTLYGGSTYVLHWKIQLRGRIRRRIL